MLTTISFEEHKNKIYKTLIDNNEFKELIILINSEIYLKETNSNFIALIKINEVGLSYLNNPDEFITKMNQMINGKISPTTIINQIQYSGDTITNGNLNESDELIELLKIEQDLLISKKLFIGNTSIEKAFARLNIMTNDLLNAINIKHPLAFNKIGAIKKWYYKYKKLNVTFDTYIYNVYSELINKVQQIKN